MSPDHRDSATELLSRTLPGAMFIVGTEPWLETLGRDFLLDMELLRRRINAPRREPRENDAAFLQFTQKAKKMKDERNAQ